MHFLDNMELLLPMFRPFHCRRSHPHVGALADKITTKKRPVRVFFLFPNRGASPFFFRTRSTEDNTLGNAGRNRSCTAMWTQDISDISGY